jgi:hypothetical protein
MSSELCAAVRSDDLPTIADALMQWVLRRNSILEIGTGQLHVLHATTANAPSGNPLRLYLSGPAEDILKDKVWQLLDTIMTPAQMMRL